LARTTRSPERDRATLARATDLLAEVMPEELQGRRVIVEGLVCGVAGTLGRLLREGRSQDAPSLHPELLTLLGTPTGVPPLPRDDGG
jgi:hypothetical protein